ncbi:dTDP-4-dehydrorhamnose reductase [Thalassotalea eurytherma]|uniref:dTDP-4-dehydrorhamnose reductase n=1 Tax=Thalassotalea eurytherma TaxID=1144278 RepID=A0ABQ6H176_9GAMM|nr:dTDP-4-dehydrorhamnose reductase [Thalassotalea eurytherma]GLX81304.1 NAD(P)-dependent oxidoreductase [Thalassotalea eurytherma]
MNILTVLVTGKGGQLATELEKTKPENVKLICLSSKELDITDNHQVNLVFKQYLPDIVINAAAYTAVDKAESERDRAFAVNQKGCENLASVCKKFDSFLVHISTDFVFDGTHSKPYQPYDLPCPISVYGESKLAGEQKVNQILACKALVVRTAWVYSAHGNNFVKTMLRLMAEKDQLSVIYDQVGTPTWAKGLARWLWVMSDKVNEIPCSDFTPIYHWTDAGVASWYDFAVAIQDLAIEKGMLSKAIPISPIETAQYPTPAKRPSFSLIDKACAEAVSGMNTVHWRNQLNNMLDELNQLS